MPIIAIATAIGSSIAGFALSKSTEIVLSPVAQKAKAEFQKKLKLGRYETIERALLGAKEDTLKKLETSEQRKSSAQIIDTLLETKASSLLTEFTSLIANTYLLPKITPFDAQPNEF